MDDTMLSSCFLEDYLKPEDYFLNDEVMFDEDNTTCESTITSDAKSLDNNTVFESIELSEISPKDEYTSSESSFQLDIDNECRLNFSSCIEKEAQLLNFSFVNHVNDSNIVNKEKMKLLERFMNEKDFEEDNFYISDSKRNDLFDIDTELVTPANFSFKINNEVQSSIKYDTRRKKGRISMVERYWKTKVDPNKKYSAKMIKKCLDMVIIDDMEHIITELVDGSSVPIPWNYFPLHALKKLCPIKKFFKEKANDRKKKTK